MFSLTAASSPTTSTFALIYVLHLDSVSIALKALKKYNTRTRNHKEQKIHTTKSFISKSTARLAYNFVFYREGNASFWMIFFFCMWKCQPDQMHRNECHSISVVLCEFVCVRLVFFSLKSYRLRFHVGVSRNASRVNTFKAFGGVFAEARECMRIHRKQLYYFRSISYWFK